jgi:hypothetical protein
MSKLIEQATIAKAQGYIYIASVVKQVFNTTYYHVVSVDDVLARGKWIPAPHCQLNCAGAHGRLGQIHLPENTILRMELWSLT